MKRNSTISNIIAVTCVVILLNVLSVRYFFRLDFTEDQRYTLSRATKDILKSLDEPITVTAYFSEGLPANFTQIRTDFKDLLTEYSNISKGMVVYEFINPNKDDETEQKTMKAGISPVIINVREKDEAVQKKAYLGAVIKCGTYSEAIPLIQPGSSMEYTLSSTIKKLTVKERPVIGFVDGFGCPSIEAMQQAVQSLSVLYRVEPVALDDSVMLDKYKTLVIVAPRTSFSDGQLVQLDNYLANGGNIYIAIDRVEGNLAETSGTEVFTGLEGWLAQKGIDVDNKFVVDANCGSVNVVQQQGFFNIQTQVKFPYLPLITNFTNHPAVSGLETVMLQFANRISFRGDSSVIFTPMALSSKKSGSVAVPTYFDVQKKWTDIDFMLPSQVVAASVEGPVVGNRNSKMVIIGDGDFAINGEANSARQLSPDNANLMVNSIDWLSDDTGLIGLRTKGVINRPLDQIEDGKKNFLKYFNFLLPIVLIILYGVVRYQRNRIRRIKRMQDGYVR